MKLRKIIVATIYAALLLSACNKEEVEQKVEEQKPVVAEPEEVVTYKQPFTGEEVEKLSTQRPVIATINNHPAARPQSGLEAADIVYEMLAEAEVTRFLALYQSELPEQVGPIRSARSYFIDLAHGLDAFYIAHGYSPEAQTMLANGIVDHINGMHYDGTYFKRSLDRIAPHNSYISKENILAGAEQVGASMTYNKQVGYAFYEADENVNEGTVASQVQVSYNPNPSFNSTYTYDEAGRYYKKSYANVEVTDLLTSDVVPIHNVLMYEMPHSIIDSYGRRDIDITDGGNAYIFQQGIMREIKWENQDGVLVPVESDGTQVKLSVGKTWIHFIPESSGLSNIVTVIQ